MLSVFASMSVCVTIICCDVAFELFYLILLPGIFSFLFHEVMITINFIKVLSLFSAEAPINLFTVSDAILVGGQTRLKLQ